MEGGEKMKSYRLELVCESGADEPEETILRTSTDVARLLSRVFAGVDREMFVVVLLDAKHRPIGINTVSLGSLTATTVHPRETFKAAIAGNAAALLLGHLHPSGDPEPSVEDREITRRLRDAGELLGIRVLDHVIVGAGDRHYSFVDAGAL
jgi:DNA repair protein RadC